MTTSMNPNASNNDELMSNPGRGAGFDDVREPIQRAASELPVAARERAERFADGFKSASERVGAGVTTAGKQAADFLGEQMTVMGARLGRLEDQVTRARSAATVAVRERPLAYLAGAAAIGAVLGTLIARPRRRAGDAEA
jgi:ElaB/YqjD/DUF883 family membrane-anchored ribosome-binding protein